MRGYGLGASKPVETVSKRVIDIRSTVPKERYTEIGRAATMVEDDEKLGTAARRGLPDGTEGSVQLPKESIPRLAANVGLRRGVRLGTYRDGGRRSRKTRKTRKHKKTHRRR
jgi:hypothetical protein